MENMPSDELKELNEFLLNKNENEDELQKIAKNSKFQLLIDRILEIEQLKKGLLEIEINEKENEKYFYSEFLSFFTFLHVANIHQYRNLVEILEETKNIDKDKIEKFENEIIIPFSFFFLEMTNIEMFEILTPLFDLAMKKDIFRSDAQIAVTKKELEVESTELDRKEFEVFINKNGKFN